WPGRPRRAPPRAVPDPSRARTVHTCPTSSHPPRAARAAIGDTEQVSNWNAPVAAGPVDAEVTVPGSKSLTNRALVLAALAEGPAGPLGDGDADLLITPGALRGADIDCGLAGTVMRFVPPIAALATGTSAFDGDPAARVRPQSVVLDALRALGAEISGDSLPFTVAGGAGLRGGRVEVDASASSQFVSGLLLAAARFDRGLDLAHVGDGPVPSGPHVEMTISMLREFGVTVDSPTPSSWRVAP